VKHALPRALRHLEGRLRDLEERGLLRTRTPPVEDVARTFCSNDYLGLAGSVGGAGASRLIVGERPEHRALEAAVTTWLDVPAALVFSSGYAANVGVLSALADPGDLVVSDQLNHASIIDGCRLSRAQVSIAPHLDLEGIVRALAAPRAGRAWVVTESYFSMDADGPDLARLRAICDDADAGLIVDEAHALGVFGDAGRGRCHAAGVAPDVMVGTFGKALGAAGAFVAGSAPLVSWLWNRARSFVFSTGLSPLVAAAAVRAIDVVRAEPELRARLHENVARLRTGLTALGLTVLGDGPIIPVPVGDARRAVEVAARLRQAGVHVQAIRPPTVPEGGARLRITTTARHSPHDIDHAIEAFEKALPWLRPSS
jgi:8-amino-7-oxononanoate synthase